MKIEKTEIYKHLLSLESGVLYAEKLKQNIEERIIPILNNIKINLPEYTSHDEIHSINVLTNMWKIIPQETKKKLSTLEVLLLIYSAYLHDMGMFICDEDEDNIPKTSEYIDYRTVCLSQQGEILDEEQILKDFVRENHGFRSLAYIEEMKDCFVFENVNYSFNLYNLCLGHTLDIEKIKFYSENTRIGSNLVNEKYLTIILRIADLLDISPNRTPNLLYEKIKPKNMVSNQEWRKHLAITGWHIDDRSVEIHAKCSEYNTERILREFIKYINKEIDDCSTCFNGCSKGYSLYLKGNISFDNIHSDGSYIYNELKFELSTSNIISLLMGNRLYSSPEFALRELLQNSVDAVLFRKEVENLNSATDNYSPQISISIKDNELTIIDNGIGMDINIFKKYFMNVGKSYYKSIEAIEKANGYTSVSEFGIGMLSSFMIADSIIVESKLRPTNLNDTTIPILVEIPTINDYFVQKKSNKQEFGTKITLILKENHPFKSIDIESFVRYCAPLIDSNINILVNNVKIEHNVENDTCISLLDLRMCEIYHSFKIKSDDFGINGYILLIKENEDFVKCKNVVAKNGFRVLNSNLLPEWANLRCVLNITNSEIKLSANREHFVVDENFIKLKNFIEEEVVSEIYKYLLIRKNELDEDKYVKTIYNLIREQIIFNRVQSSKEEQIPRKIQELILVPVVDKNNNKQYKSVKELLFSSNIVTYSRIPYEYKEKFDVPYSEIFDILAKYELSNVLLVDNSKINSYSTQIILSKLGLYVDKFVTTSINGFNIFILTKNETNIPFLKSWYRLSFAENICINSKKQPLYIQLQPYGLVLGFTDKIYNMKHKFIQTYLRVEQIDDVYIKGSITKIFDEFKSKVDESDHFRFSHYKKDSVKERIKKIYLEELNVIAKKLWDSYKENNLVPKNSKFKEITEDDFPFGLTFPYSFYN